MKIIHEYYFYFIAICLLFATDTLYAQYEGTASAFPLDWIGSWKGDLVVHQAGQDSTQIIPMELNIHPNDSVDRWQWQIVYVIDGERAPRDYELIEVDAAKGHYAVDEKNSIILDSYLMGGVLASRFSVGKSLLITTYRMDGDELWFEIFFGNQEETTQTGGKGDIPEVLSFPFGMRQVARLKKQ